MTRPKRSPVEGDFGSGNRPDDLLTSIAKAAASVLVQVKTIRMAGDLGADAVGAHAALVELLSQFRLLEKLAAGVASQEAAYSERAAKQFLELEFSIREACRERGWRVDGQWPTLYVERAIAVEISEAKRCVTVARKRLAGTTARAVVGALDPLVRGLLPKGFSPANFIRDLAEAYDSSRGNSTQLPVFHLYRELVVRSQGARFWRDARSDTFNSISAEQFRARLTAALEAEMTSLIDGREIRLLPPLNSDDGLFMYLPAESRYGFVGRVEFVPTTRTEAG